MEEEEDKQLYRRLQMTRQGMDEKDSKRRFVQLKGQTWLSQATETWNYYEIHL